MESLAPHQNDPRHGESVRANTTRTAAAFRPLVRLLFGRSGFTSTLNSSRSMQLSEARQSAAATLRHHLTALLLASLMAVAALPLPARAAGLPLQANFIPEPTQGPVGDKASWQSRGYEIEPLATYDITARVLSVKHYPDGTDRFADVSSVDLALGWGRMADRDLLEQLDVRQDGRWYFVKWRGLPLTAEQVIESSANTHILPASPEVAEKLARVKAGDVVTLKGYLVNTRGSDGWLWESSVTRTDTAGGSCESVWVEEVEVHPDEPITYASLD
jgi:hypothetical protein